MRILLYQFTGENNRVDKTSEMILRGEIVGTLRDTSDVLNPVITFITSSNAEDKVTTEDDALVTTAQGENVVIPSSDPTINNINLFACNYAYIVEFHRYYFVMDLVSLHNNVWQMSMNVDVLMSYKDEILSQSAMIARNEFSYDNRLEDKSMNYSYDKIIEEYIPAKGDKVNTTFNPQLTTDPIDALTAYHFVFSVISDQYTGDLEVVNPPAPSLPRFLGNAYSMDSTNVFACRAVDLRVLGQYIMTSEAENIDAKSYVKNIISLPFSLVDGIDCDPSISAAYVKDKKISVNNVDMQTKSMLYHSMSRYYVIADFTIASDGSYLDYGEYTSYEMYLPYVGWISLNADDILNCRLIVYYVMSFEDATSSVYVHDITHDKIIYSGSCQLGVKIGLTSDNSKEIANQQMANQLSMGVTTLTSVLSIAAGIATENPVAVAGGVINLGAGIANYATKQAQLRTRANASIGSGTSGMYCCQDVKIRKTKSIPLNNNEQYAHCYGRPLNRYRDLNSLHGFTTVASIHLTNFTGLANEKSSVISLLTNGVFLP